MKNVRILITHVSYQAASGSFIKLLRNSKKYKYYIVGCDQLEKGFSSGSLLVDTFYHVTYNPNEPEYIDSIQSICLKEEIDLIITAEEDDLIIFKKNKISQAIYQSIPDFAIFNLFKDKHLANVELSSKKFLIPKSLYNLEEFHNSKRKKYISRKRISCCSRGIKIFDKNDIPDDFKFYNEQYITQEYLVGEEYTVDILCNKKGIPHLIIPRVSLASKDGTTFKCIIKKEQQLIDICKKIYSLYCIPGISNIQFIIEEDQAYFIELNPRTAATMIASSLVSVNFMDLYVSHFLFDEELPDYDILLSKISWNSIISRYYEETVLYANEQ